MRLLGRILLLAARFVVEPVAIQLIKQAVAYLTNLTRDTYAGALQWKTAAPKIKLTASHDFREASWNTLRIWQSKGFWSSLCFCIVLLEPLFPSCSP